MTGFDLLLILLAAILILFEIRHDAGRALLDAVATVAAALVSRILAPAVTQWLHFKPFPGAGYSPLAQGLAFVGCWILALVLARILHRYTRWSMDQWDPVFGCVFALVMAVTAGHVTTAVVGTHELMVHRKVPRYLANSFFGEELRSFRSYHYVLETLGSARIDR